MMLRRRRSGAGMRRGVGQRRRWVGVVGVLAALACGAEAFLAMPLRRLGRTPAALRTESLLRREAVSMVGFFNRRRSSADKDVVVTIESLAPNIRRISGTCVVDCPMEDVWAVLTDYDNLSEHVPNLVESRRTPHPTGPQAIRLFQEGAQKIIGLDFRASLTMDMKEVMAKREMDALPTRAIKFNIVESRMFKEFDGEWKLDCFSRKRVRDETTGQLLPGFTYSTKMFYQVTIKPRGVVPVAALEWRIKEDVPTNMLAVKKAAEERGPELIERMNRRLQDQAAHLAGTSAAVTGETSAMGFETGETLEAYVAQKRKGGKP